MTKRTFLNNSMHIQHAMAGKHVTPYLGTGFSNATPCTDYVLEKKKEKCLLKLDDILLKENKKKNQAIRKYNFHTEIKLIKKCENKDELIRFITSNVKNANDVKEFFKDFNLK